MPSNHCQFTGFVQLVSAYLNFEESKYLGAFLYSLANNLSDETLREQLLNFEVTSFILLCRYVNNLYYVKQLLS